MRTDAEVTERVGHMAHLGNAQDRQLTGCQRNPAIVPSQTLVTWPQTNYASSGIRTRPLETRLPYCNHSQETNAYAIRIVQAYAKIVRVGADA